MKEKSGIKTLEARITTKEGKFNVVPLTENRKAPTVNHQQIKASVINSMQKRMFKRMSSHESQVTSTPS